VMNRILKAALRGGFFVLESWPKCKRPVPGSSFLHLMAF